MRLIPFFAALLLAVGCSDSTSPDTYESIGGLWVGTAAHTPQYTGDIAFQIVDRGGSLTGDVRFAFGEDVPTWPFVGTREGSRIRLAIAFNSADSSRVVATIYGDEIAGTITLDAVEPTSFSVFRQ